MSLKIWLPLNGSLQESITERGISNTNATINSAGKIGQCYRFNGSAYLSHAMSANDIAMINNCTQFTIACWVKFDTVQDGWGQIFTIGTAGTSWNNINIGFDNKSGTATYFSVSDSSSATHTNCGSGKNLQDNQWHHLIGTYNQGTMAMYVDGVRTSTLETQIRPTFSGTSPAYIFIGGNQNGEQAECYINDVRFYDHCLSPREIKLLAQGLVAHYKLDDPSIEPTTNLLNGVWPHTSFWNAPLGTYSSFSNQLGTGSLIEIRQFHNRQCLYIKGGSDSNNRCYKSISVSGDKSYTFSLDLYSTSTTNVFIKCEATGGDYGSSWPTIGSATYTTPNQWQRLSFTIQPDTNPTLYFFIQTPNSNEIYVNNIQLEERSCNSVHSILSQR